MIFWSGLRRKQKTLALSAAGLALFLLWQAWSLHRYIQADARPPSWDQAVHLEIALDYRNAIRDGRWSDLLYLPPKPGMPPFPPLYHLALIPAYRSAAPAQAALWVNWFYLVLLCAAIFGVAWEFLQSELALAAAILFAGAPAIQWLLHNQLIDLPLTACSAAAYWTLVRSDGFKRRMPSLGFGLVFAAGMLHKWSFFSYMMPAYYLALKQRHDGRSRRNIATAAAVAAAVSLPWYWAHLPVLPARLAQASADMAVPVWRGLAFFDYFLNMINEFGLPFWLLAWIGLLLRYYKSKQNSAWVLPASVLTAYVFWSIVPNRQMRFLLPGLPAMAVLACASFPKPVVWGAALFQLVAAANYPAGFISMVRPPPSWTRVHFFESDPPKREDWKVLDILREAQRRHDGGDAEKKGTSLPAAVAPGGYAASGVFGTVSAPRTAIGAAVLGDVSDGAAIANLTLVANAQYFNPPTFAWARKYLELPDIRIRGVNRRLCEFSEFVVLKSGSPGPPGVIGGLPEAAEIITRDGSWFARSYDPVSKWPLPDGSAAILYQRRKWKVPPFRDKHYSFDYYRQDPLSAGNLKVFFGPWKAERSAYEWIRISAAQAELRGFKMSRLELEMRDVLMAPAGDSPLTRPWEDIRFLKMKELKIRSLIVTADDVKEFLENRVSGLQVAQIRMDKTIQLDARYKGIPCFAEAAVAVAREGGRRGLEITARRLRLAGVAVPLRLLERFKTFRASLDPNPETPFAIDLPPATIADGRLIVGRF